MNLVYRFARLGLNAFFFLYSLWVTSSLYRNGHFKYHDLGLISDFMSNTVFGRGFFQVTETGVNHFSMHFTPTLLLLAPLYRIFDSQYLLLALGCLSVFLAIEAWSSIATRLHERLPMHPEDRRSPWVRRMTLLFVFFLAMNRYTKALLLAAHFEIVGLALFSWIARSLVFGAPLRRVLLPWVLLLGLRQDYGLLAAPPLLALGLLPKPFQGIRVRAFALAGASLAASLVLILWVHPLFGYTGDWHLARFWSGFGRSWPEALKFMATHPDVVWGRLGVSGWGAFLGSMGPWPLFAPGTLITGLAISPLFFVSTSADKAELLYYNSVFFLPGFWLAAFLGLRRALRWRGEFLRSSGVALRLMGHGITAMILIHGVVQLQHWNGVADPFHRYEVKPESELARFRSELDGWLARCPGIKSVASDFYSYTFLPNRLEKRLLRAFHKSDAVAVSRGPALELSGHTSSSDLDQALRGHPDFRVVHDGIDGLFLVKHGIACR